MIIRPATPRRLPIGLVVLAMLATSCELVAEEPERPESPWGAEELDADTGIQRRVDGPTPDSGASNVGSDSGSGGGDPERLPRADDPETSTSGASGDESLPVDRLVYSFVRNEDSARLLDGAVIADPIDVRFETDSPGEIERVEWTLDDLPYRDNDQDAPYNLRYNRLLEIGAILTSDQGFTSSWNLAPGSEHTITATVVQANGRTRDVIATFVVGDGSDDSVQGSGGSDGNNNDGSGNGGTNDGGTDNGGSGGEGGGSGGTQNTPVVTTPAADGCWNPPAGWEDYQHVAVPAAGGNVELQAGKDYLLVFPDQPVDERIRVVGGQNVAVMGGHIRIDEFYSQTNRRFGMQWTGQTGVVHIEGLRIDGAALTEGIQLNGLQNAQAQIQNVYFGELTGAYDLNHGDYIQVNHGIGLNQPWALRLCRITGRPSHYQFLIYGNDSGPIDVRYVNFMSAPGSNDSRNEMQGGWINFFNGPADQIHYEPGTVWAAPNPDRFGGNLSENVVPRATGEHTDETGTYIEWDQAYITGRIYKGTPPGGDYVSPSSVGIGYESP